MIPLAGSRRGGMPYRWRHSWLDRERRDAGAMLKLIPTVRGGAVNSALVFATYGTLDEARDAVKALIHENGRVTRVMIVDEANGSKFVEWVERS